MKCTCEATEGKSGKFNLYNPYLAPADMTSAPRVHFSIGRTGQPENFDLREEFSDLGCPFREAIAQNEGTFPYNYVMLFVRSPSSSENAGNVSFTRYRYFRLELDLLAAWVESENFRDEKAHGYKSVLGALYWMMGVREGSLMEKSTELLLYGCER